jgi:hypothetical protein
VTHELSEIKQYTISTIVGHDVRTNWSTKRIMSGSRPDGVSILGGTFRARSDNISRTPDSLDRQKPLATVETVSEYDKISVHWAAASRHPLKMVRSFSIVERRTYGDPDGPGVVVE